MHAHTIDYRKDRGERGALHNKGWHLWIELAENPWCWLFGHSPFVYRLPLGFRAHGETEYRWIECKVCGRRSDRQVPKSPTPVNFEQLASDVARRSGWSGHTAEFGAQTVIRKKPDPEFSLRFHLGSRGSETPVDAHATIGGSGIYLNTSLFSRLAGRLTRGEGRDLSLSLHSGTLRWKAWVGEDDHRSGRSRSGKYRSWASRSGNISVRPLDYLLGGPQRYSYTDVDGPRTALLATNEGTEHTVKLTLQRVTLARPRGPKKLSWSVEWKCAEGIPYRNHDWKGDCMYGSSERVDSPDEWVAAAINGLRDRTTRDRDRYHWQQRVEVDES